MTINSRILSLLLAIYFGTILNITVFHKLFLILSSLDKVKLGLVFCVPILFVTVLNIIFSVVTIKYIEKPIIIFWLISSSIVSYQMFYYGVVFDSEMFVNIFETNMGESWSFINLHILCWVTIFGLLPAYLVLKSKITHETFFKELSCKIISICLSLGILCIIYILYYKDISSIGRNNRHLRTVLVPTYFTYGFTKYIKNTYFKFDIPYKELGKDIQSIENHRKSKKNLIIIAIGETARSANFQLNGYLRDTNKYTKQYEVVYFKNVTSCGTATAISLPCMFSSLTRKDYNHDIAVRQDNLIDILKRTNTDMSWIDNDSGCKGVCDHIKNTKLATTKNKWCDGLYCVDEILFDKAKDKLEKLSDKDTMVFLHLIGSHGPTYYRRYPKQHKLYTPDCSKSDIQNCNHEELVNTYDNTIAYTDYVLFKLIELLKTKNHQWNTSLIYISDHGESLGEYGMYLHGAPYFMAPKEQINIPMLMWFSDDFAYENNIDIMKLSHNAEAKAYSHDNFFHSILGLMGAKTDIYDSNLDIFSDTRTS